MTFIEALQTGRPMRRKRVPPEWARNFDPEPGTWLLLGQHPDWSLMSEWHQLDTGQRTALSRADYLADDWEVWT